LTEHFRRRRSQRVGRGVTATLCTLLLAGCATHSYRDNHHHAGGEASGLDIADANNNGAYVQAGPLTYQLQISRELNQYGVEDRQYVTGLPAGMAQPRPNQEWFGVFMWAKNQTHTVQTTAPPADFVIKDTQGNTYRPVALESSRNPFAWTSQQLQPGAVEPGAESIAGRGFTGGGLLLYKVYTTIYDNRPLTLDILGANGRILSTISLDL
jgi:hypothetical protein